MRQFYELVGEVKWNTLCSKLSWSHYREVLSLKDKDEIRYYLNESENNNLTQRQLHELIKRDAYNRLSINIKDKIIREHELKVSELKKEHIGGIEIYMNYINKNLKTLDENDTVGIIICKKDNKYVIEYCSDNRVISRVYELV